MTTEGDRCVVECYIQVIGDIFTEMKTVCMILLLLFKLYFLQLIYHNNLPPERLVSQIMNVGSHSGLQKKKNPIPVLAFYWRVFLLKAELQ
jgi:hypothetical protein